MKNEKKRFRVPWFGLDLEWFFRVSICIIFAEISSIWLSWHCKFHFAAKWWTIDVIMLSESISFFFFSYSSKQDKRSNQITIFHDSIHFLPQSHARSSPLSSHIKNHFISFRFSIWNWIESVQCDVVIFLISICIGHFQCFQSLKRPKKKKSSVCSLNISRQPCFLHNFSIFLHSLELKIVADILVNYLRFQLNLTSFLVLWFSALETTDFDTNISIENRFSSFFVKFWFIYYFRASDSLHVRDSEEFFPWNWIILHDIFAILLFSSFQWISFE